MNTAKLKQTAHLASANIAHSANLPVSELHQLLSQISEHGSQHLLDAEADLQQTLHLLEQAIQTLGNGFVTVHEKVRQRQAMVDAMLQAHEISHTQEADWVAMDAELEQHINQVVTALQFQDLTNQLLTRSIKRISGLRDLLTALASHSADAGLAAQYDTAEQLLQHMHVSFCTKSGAISAGLLQEVKQKHMQSGDIELF